MGQNTIRTHLRVRPAGPQAKAKHELLQPDANTVLIRSSDAGSSKQALFDFSTISGPQTAQSDFYTETTMPLLAEFLSDGQNVLLLGYGPTGSGKTFTLDGREAEDRGILPRLAESLMESIRGHETPKDSTLRPCRLNEFERAPLPSSAPISSTPPKSGALQDSTGAPVVAVDASYTYSVFVSFTEIHNEKVYDLLESSHAVLGSPSPAVAAIPGTPGRSVSNSHGGGLLRSLFGLGGAAKRTALSLRSTIEPPSSSTSADALLVTGGRTKYVSGQREVRVHSLQECMDLIEQGRQARRVSATGANNTSSRSHACFTFKVIRSPLHGEESGSVVSRFSVVDLAGSERVANTHTSGERLKEAGNINKGLMVLGQCLNGLKENQTLLAQAEKTEKGARKVSKRLVVPPYSQSVLTEMLKSFFVGEGCVAIILTISPHNTSFEENFQALKFGATARHVHTLQAAPLPPAPAAPAPTKGKKAGPLARVAEEEKGNETSWLMIDPTLNNTVATVVKSPSQNGRKVIRISSMGGAGGQQEESVIYYEEESDEEEDESDEDQDDDDDQPDQSAELRALRAEFRGVREFNNRLLDEVSLLREEVVRQQIQYQLEAWEKVQAVNARHTEEMDKQQVFYQGRIQAEREAAIDKEAKKIDIMTRHTQSCEAEARKEGYNEGYRAGWKARDEAESSEEEDDLIEEDSIHLEQDEELAEQTEEEEEDEVEKMLLADRSLSVVDEDSPLHNRGRSQLDLAARALPSPTPSPTAARHERQRPDSLPGNDTSLDPLMLGYDYRNLSVDAHEDSGDTILLPRASDASSATQRRSMTPAIAEEDDVLMAPVQEEVEESILPAVLAAAAAAVKASPPPATVEEDERAPLTRSTRLRQSTRQPTTTKPRPSAKEQVDPSAGTLKRSTRRGGGKQSTGVKGKGGKKGARAADSSDDDDGGDEHEDSLNKSVVISKSSSSAVNGTKKKTRKLAPQRKLKDVESIDDITESISASAGLSKSTSTRSVSSATNGSTRSRTVR